VTPNPQAPVLIIGGSGIVGSQAARALRRLHPTLPLAIGGRDVTKAEAIAKDVGNASALPVDVALADLGVSEDRAFSAVVVFLKDHWLNSMRFAQRLGVPYISLSSGAFEIGPEVAQYIHAPDKAPILLASHWLAGAALFPTLHYAKAFRTVEVIRIGVLLDEEDMGGAAAYADFERITGTAPAALTLQDGKFVWRRIDDDVVKYVSVDGVEVGAQRYSPFDIMSLAASIDARSISMNLAYTTSASRRRGEPFSTEIVIDIDGVTPEGAYGRMHHEIVHPGGQAPLTALNVALAVERMLGLAGAPPPVPGLFFPELLLDPAYVVRRMEEFGARFSSRSVEVPA
jgi:hypothetical protein